MPSPFRSEVNTRRVSKPDFRQSTLPCVSSSQVSGPPEATTSGKPHGTSVQPPGYYLLVVSYEGAEQLIVNGQAFEIPENAAYIIQPGVLAEQIGSEKGSRPAYLHFDVMYNPRHAEHGEVHSFATDLDDRSHLLQPSSLEVWGVDLPVRVPPALQPLFARDPQRARGGQTSRLSQPNSARSQFQKTPRHHLDRMTSEASGIGTSEPIDERHSLAPGWECSELGWRVDPSEPITRNAGVASRSSTGQLRSSWD